MEYLKALEEAKQLGVTKEYFEKMWKSEMKLKMMSEESKALELRLACTKHPELKESINAGDHVKGILKSHLKELQQAMMLHNEMQLQEISNLLENQAALITAMIRNELSSVLNEFTSRMSSELHQTVKNISGTHQLPLATCTENGLQQQMQKQGHVSTEQGFQIHEDELFPSEEGAILWVRNVESIVPLRQVKKSPVYCLSDCPCKVQLSLWFDENQIITAELSVFSATEKHLKACRIFTVTGEIKNRNSGSFSPLFEGKSQPLRKLNPDKEKVVNTNICLITGSGTFDDVTFDDLDKRGFVINNYLVIKWYIKSEEAK